MSKFSNKWFRAYFNFSKKDRNGIIVLSILVLLVFAANIIIDYIPQRTDGDYTEFEKALQEWEQSETNVFEKAQSLFPFNPNTISESSLDSLLLPEYVKRNLINYRKAGGKIKAAPDFRKIYGMNDSIYSVIEDYIQIPDKRISEKKLNSEKVADRGHQTQNEEAQPIMPDNQPPRLQIELNAADSTKLVELNGVGPVFASRIIKFRNLLGGFYTKRQLLEVYNFPEETYKNISGNITIDTLKINKIRINFADFSELLRHPYLNKMQVQSIINYRTNNGAFDSLHELVNLSLVDSATFIKIKPYLSSR